MKATAYHREQLLLSCMVQTKKFLISKKKQELLIRVTTLVLIYIVAFAIRLFSIVRFESVIHEFDPYFNYRTTIFLVEKGFYEFWNWFDHETWYPLGRIIGGTLYPGLMVTAALIYWALRAVHFAVHIREVCVLTAPFFASNTAMVAYFFGKEIRDSSTGLLAAAFLAICPGYISRSVAGSYDNEAIAIFALVLTFYLFVRAVRTGSLAWSVASAFSYFYMVSAWGGYIFIINLVPLYVLVLLVSGRYSPRLYIAYNTLYLLGSLLAMQIRFVGFQHVQSGEHMAAMGTFALLQVFFFVQWVRQQLVHPKLFQAFLRVTLVGFLSATAMAVFVGFATGYISPWTGRFYSLLDPTYAKLHIPIIASVSEHQPTTWASFFFDYHILLLLVTPGLYFCFKNLNEASIFIVIYTMTSLYFAGVMVRLILVATPAVCLVAAVGGSGTLHTIMHSIREQQQQHQQHQQQPPPPSVDSSASLKRNKAAKVSARLGKDRGPLGYEQTVSFFFLVAVFYGLCKYTLHCTWATSAAYSSPSIVLLARSSHGSPIIFDDFRAAYSWLHYNTRPDAKIMSWWDYGYQITGMANRTVIVDNNTWNNTHIATVGMAMASTEEDAYPIMRQLGVDYVLVIFGGVAGYGSDDVNKFLWMVRIGGGVFPQIRERDFLTGSGEYTVGAGAPESLVNSIMYKMCYYRFGEVSTEPGRANGYDRIRGVEISKKDIELEHLEEVFTSENWIVRIYRVKPQGNRW